MEQKKIGQFIQTLRKEADLTQKDLAEKIGVSDKTISKWENGNGLPDLESLNSLSSFFDVSINEVLAGERKDAETYSKNSEKVIVDLIKKNQKNHKLGIWQGCMGLLICCVSCVLFFIQEYGMSFSMYLPSFVDVQSFIILLTLCASCICLGGVSGKRTMIIAISKTIVPIGFIVTSAKILKLLIEGTEGSALMIAFSLCLLPLFYSVIVYLFACVARMKMEGE